MVVMRWRGFTDKQVSRAMRRVEFIVLHDHAGLRGARRAATDGAIWHRRRFHFAQDAILHAATATIRRRKGLQPEPVRIADDRAPLATAQASFVDSYRKSAPKRATTLEENIPAGLAVL